LRKEHKLEVFENKGPRKLSAAKKNVVTEQFRILPGEELVTYSAHLGL
jgi:hypothetical protein